MKLLSEIAWIIKNLRGVSYIREITEERLKFISKRFRYRNHSGHNNSRSDIALFNISKGHGHKCGDKYNQSKDAYNLSLSI